MSDTDILSNQQLRDYLEELPHWREIPGAIAAVFQTKTSAAAIELFSDIAGAAEMDNHHPDVDWRYNRLFVSTTSHDAGGAITARDIALASKISERAEALGAKPRVDLIGAVEIGIDTDDPAAIAAQWAAGLGYKVQEDGSLADPDHRKPAIWSSRRRPRMRTGFTWISGTPIPKAQRCWTRSRSRASRSMSSMRRASTWPRTGKGTAFASAPKRTAEPEALLHVLD
ncbi:MAG: 4a-hydroxytetrahydrobiopterin dehydratase [Glutamicibacter arilaitensis]|uniref:4a-hydroxytetrahydrobiopterin dehydratase n=1 Tax=Glutamicibacter arilaitensis TaxID=256701 RepID=UPI003FD14B6E